MSDETREGWVNLDGGARNVIFSAGKDDCVSRVPATLIIHHPAKEYIGNACRVFKKEKGVVYTRARHDAPWEKVWAYRGATNSAYVGGEEPANLRALADCMEDK